MAATKFFAYPFAVSGTVTPVPDTLQLSGSVSYQQGFGVDYTLAYGVDPAALPIPQGGVNQIFYDITSGIQQYQSIGTPNFINASQTVDTNPYPYIKNAYALWTDGNIYQSLVGTNATTPANTATWRLDDNNAGKIILPNVVFEGTVVSGNAVYWNAGTSQYTKAIANGSIAQQVIGIADVTNNRLYVSGDVAILSGLTSGSQYYLDPTTPGNITATPPGSNAVPVGIAISATELILSIITLSPSSVGLPSGAMIDFAGPSVPFGFLNCDGTAVSRTTYANLFAAIGVTWGPGDGSTTFNLPPPRVTTVGSGGTGTGTLGNTVGSVGGTETVTLTTAMVPNLNVTAAGNLATGNGTYTLGGQIVTGGTPTQTGTITINSTGATTNGGGGAHNNLQPSIVVLRAIKT